MEKSVTVLSQLNSEVASVISETKLVGFEKAYKIATAAGNLKKLLNAEYMKPIMDLQNNRLGFKTDKPSGYDEATVKNCLIEAVLMGVQPFGNQFNIIAGSSYITKEGYGYLLKNFPGLSYEIIPSLPRIKDESAAVLMKITWQLNGSPTVVRELDIPIKANKFMGADGVIGKATRKARAWLFNTLNDSEFPDGDISDMEGVAQRPTAVDPRAVASDKSRDRVISHIEKSDTAEMLAEVKDEAYALGEEVIELYESKLATFL